MGQDSAGDLKAHMVDQQSRQQPLSSRAAPIGEAAAQPLEATTYRAVRQALAAMVIAALILLVFNSDGLRTYARNLPDSQFTDQAVLLSDQWHALMRSVGCDRPKIWVGELMQALREA